MSYDCIVWTLSGFYRERSWLLLWPKVNIPLPDLSNLALCCVRPYLLSSTGIPRVWQLKHQLIGPQIFSRTLIVEKVRSQKRWQRVALYISLACQLAIVFLSWPIIYAIFELSTSHSSHGFFINYRPYRVHVNSNRQRWSICGYLKSSSDHRSFGRAE